MATVHLHVARNPHRLLELAAEAFLRPQPRSDDPFASPPHVLVLRQGGLRDDLLALAAARGVPGWFDPPLCVFAQIPEWLGATGTRPLGDYERVVLIERSLRETIGTADTGRSMLARVSRPEAYIDAVDRLFGELMSEGVEPDDVERAVLAQPGSDAFEVARDAEVLALYRRYHALLTAEGRRDGRDRLLDSARAVRADAAALAQRLRRRREIRIVGLQDLKGGWNALLQALADSPALDVVRIYTSSDLGLPATLNAVLHTEYASDGSEPTRQSTPTQESAKSTKVSVPSQESNAQPQESNAQPSRRTRKRAASPDQMDLLDASPLPVNVPVNVPVNAPARLTVTGPAPLPGRPPTPTPAAFSAPDPDREVEEVAVRIRRLIEAGTPPRRIAVIARQARPYVDRVCDAFERVGVPVTARRRHPFAEIPVVRAVLSIFAVAAGGWTRHGLVELAEGPYLSLRLDADVLNHIGFRRRVEGLVAWTAALERLLGEARALEARTDEGEDESVRRERLPRADRVERARDRFRTFSALAGALDAARPLTAWLDWFDDFLERDPWRVGRRIWAVPAGHERVARLDLAGWRGIRDIIGEWRKAVGTWGGATEALDVRTFERRLRETLSGDAALWTETRRGVQVLEALAAAHRTFDHVFLVGLDAERVPVRMPRSPLLDEADRARLAAAGLPLELRETWDARERELLGLLASSASQSLTFCWARQDAAGAEVARSSFAESLLARHAIEVEEIATSRVVTPGVPLVGDAASTAFAEHGARIEAVRATGAPSPWNGLVEDPAILERIAAKLGEEFVWSPTQLEAYAKCPFAWFSARVLRVAKLDDPELDLDARVRGTIFHDALHRFYDAARARVGGPVFLREGDAAWAQPLAAASLAEALCEAADEVWLGHLALRATKEDELRRDLARYIAFEIEHNEKMHTVWQRAHIVRTGVDAHELPFEGLVLERAGVRIRLRGLIDRTETGLDPRADTEHLVAAVDYKSSTYSAPGLGKSAAWDDDVVLQVPLYAWVLTQLRPGVEVARAEYRSIRQREIVHPLHLHRIERRTGALYSDAGDTAKLDRALDAVARHVGDARAGLHPARPAPSCGCPSFCHAWEICRVRGGPSSLLDW
jgi:superfamily I DNA/RNA helicase/RecB family exonuclease